MGASRHVALLAAGQSACAFRCRGSAAWTEPPPVAWGRQATALGDALLAGLGPEGFEEAQFGGPMPQASGAPDAELLKGVRPLSGPGLPRVDAEPTGCADRIRSEVRIGPVRKCAAQGRGML